MPGEARSGFERTLAVLLGFDKTAEALRSFRSLGGLSVLLPEALLGIPPAAFASSVGRAGNARLKLPRVRGFLDFAAARAEQGDELFAPESPFYAPDAEPEALWALFDFEELRSGLARIRGISLESADLALLFAFNYPVFPVGAQAWRFLRRHGFIAEDADYREMQEIIQGALDMEPGGFKDETINAAGHYKESWLLLRQLCTDFCTASKFLCSSCPLGAYMEYQPCE